MSCVAEITSSMTFQVSIDSELVVVTQQSTGKQICQIHQQIPLCHFGCLLGIWNKDILTYFLVEKHVWEGGMDSHHTKAAYRADDNPKDCNEEDVLETGLVWTEILAEQADVLPPGDHHEADEDRVRIEHAGDLDVGEVAKVLEAALKHLGDEVCAEEFPADVRRAESVYSGETQGYDKQLS